MSVEAQHYDPSAYGSQHVGGDGAAPVVRDCRCNVCQSSLGNTAVCCRCGHPSQRPPCCCEVFREGAAVPHQHQHQHQQYGAMQRPHQRKQKQREGDDELLQETYRSSSRRCLCCIPEQEELQEYERLKKEQKYRSMRAEREQLQAALYDDLRQGVTPRHLSSAEFSYRPNTAQLLRYSQGSFYQRAVALEQERRRRELRREIEAKKREMSARGRMHYCHYHPIAPYPSVRGTTRIIGSGRQLSRGRMMRGSPVTVLPTTGLRQHHDLGRGARTPTSKATLLPHGGGRGSRSPPTSARKHNKGTDPHTRKSTTAPVSDVGEGTATKPSEAHSPSRYRCKEEQKKISASATPSRRGGGCGCCCGYECHCRPCLCCKCYFRAKSADAISTVPHTTETTPAVTTEQKRTEGVKTSAPPPPQQQPVPRTKAQPSPKSRSRPTSVEHGRKVYITDDAYLSRRTKVIEQLEKDGYVRPLSPKTRSPSAPLPEKVQRWATTRSTSAHRVCV